MPELPEVETIVRALGIGGREGPSILNRVIDRAEFFWPRALVEGTPQQVSSRLVGQSVLQVTRRAKWIVINLNQESLLVHLRMSGDLRVLAPGVPQAPHDRFVMTFTDGWRLVLNDPRKFGRIWLTADPGKALADLGPEPLEAGFDPQMFFQMLGARHRLIKPLLMDQHFLAGMGNIYTDEALHHAGIHPLRSSDSLNLQEVTRLWEALRAVLRQGIERNGASIDWVYRGGDFQNDFYVYGRAGQACKTCGQPVERLVVGQRGTHVCPNCQPLTGFVQPTGGKDERD